MSRISAIVFFACVILSGCKMGKVSIGEDNLFHLEHYPTDGGITKGVPLLEYNSGYINDFKKDNINNWHGSDKIILSKENGVMKVSAADVGIEYDRFVCGLHPSRDFTKTGVIKIRAKVIAKSAPVLRLDLKDKNGNGTNHANITMRMVNCDGFVDYYFDFSNKDQQDVPFPHKVDKENIIELEFFINPGGDQFKGDILIQEIEAIDSKNLLAAMAKSKALNTCVATSDIGSKNDIKEWGSNSSKYTFSKEDNAVKVTVHGAAPGYESFGKSFLSIDISKNPILRIRAKAIGKESPELRVDLVDVNGNATNGKEINKTISNDGKYADYYFNFSGRLYMGWPETKSVDGHAISELMIFVNSGGPAFFGDIFISEIEIVKDEVKPKDRMTQLLTRKDTSDIAIYEPGADFSTWWTSDPGTKVVMENNALTFNINSGKESTITTGMGFDVIDFTKHPLLQFKIKNEEKNNLKIFLKLYDINGNSTDAIPIINYELNANSDFANFTYDLIKNLKSDKSAERTNLDVGHISGLSLSFEKASDFIAGKIYLKEVTALSANSTTTIMKK